MVKMLNPVSVQHVRDAWLHTGESLNAFIGPDLVAM